MHKEFERLSQMIAHKDVLKTEISGWSIGWHIEHSLTVVIGVCKSAIQSEPAAYQWKFNPKRFLILDITGRIPRGKAKAPKIVQPQGRTSTDELQAQLAKAKELYAQFEQAHANAHFEHPIFGQLNKKPTDKFLGIHTRHHLYIMDDLLAK
jgi:hypothetical protein